MIMLSKVYRGEDEALLARLPDDGGTAIGAGVNVEIDAFRLRHSEGNDGNTCHAAFLLI